MINSIEAFFNVGFNNPSAVIKSSSDLVQTRVTPTVRAKSMRMFGESRLIDSVLDELEGFLNHLAIAEPEAAKSRGLEMPRGRFTASFFRNL